MTKRLLNIDILKFIGIICIIIAHTNPPKILFQIRNFDVILMCIISIFLFFNSNKKEKYISYIKKRFIRLVIPTWIFLTIFFILNYFFKYNNYNISNIIGSYILQDNSINTILPSIGYVWIIRIFLLVAILLPIFNILKNKLDFNILFIFTILIYLIYEILCSLGVFNNSIIQYLFAYIIPCFLLICITYLIKESNNKRLLLISFILLIIFIIEVILLYIKYGYFIETQTLKYPFRYYYLTYALLISTILIYIFRHDNITNIIYNKFIGFISKHSLWIYLWHILFLQIIKFKEWYINFILILVLSVLVTYIQSIIVSFLKNKGVSKKLLCVFEG